MSRTDDMYPYNTNRERTYPSRKNFELQSHAWYHSIPLEKLFKNPKFHLNPMTFKILMNF